MRDALPTQWEPTVPALLQMVAASGGPRLRAAFAEAGLDGIHPAQSFALAPLVAGGLHASALADRLGVSRQAVAQAVGALEQHGYVMRTPDPLDGRVRIIELTARGRKALRVMRANAVDLEHHWQRLLGEDKLDELRRSLLTLLTSDRPKAARDRPAAD